MDGLTFQRFLMATFCVICQSVTRGIALWERELPDELTHLGEQFVLSTSVLLYHALCNKSY